MNSYWVRKEIKTRFTPTSTDHVVRDDVRADTHEEAIRKAFDVEVVEAGIVLFGIVTQASNENGFRYWRVINQG